MSIENACRHLKKWNKDKDIIELKTSSATVELAAQALGVVPARIAKTLSYKKVKNEEECALLIVTAGDAKIDNSKFKGEFGFKAKMLTLEEVILFTGHEVGGVCPFGVTNSLPVYLDISLKRFESVFPACGSGNSAIELTCSELDEYSLNKKWVDVCKGWEENKF